MKPLQNISINEFHINRAIREQCKFNEELFASSGNVIFANLAGVRTFTMRLNEYLKQQGMPAVFAGQINAMGLLDEIFHYVCMYFRRELNLHAFAELLQSLDKEYGAEAIDRLLLEFSAEFPPTAVFKGETAIEEYMGQSALDAGTKVMRPNREATFEELMLLMLSNENPALKQYYFLFDDTKLKANPIFKKVRRSTEAFFKKQPKIGRFAHRFIEFLKEPVVASPDSLKGQLDYIRVHWADILGDWLLRILAGLDMISEEEKAAWQPMIGGPGPMPSISYENLMKEYERFSPDKDWMPNVVLMAKTVLVWLDQLSKKYNRSISRLDQIPDEELDTLAAEGFTGLWLIGLWERSPASRQIKQLCGNPEAAASAYSLDDYTIAYNLGGWDALNNLRSRLWARGVRLASDMVPNHTGMDSRWVAERPDLFVQRRDNPFPQYTFNGPNLSQRPGLGVYLEDHYYSKSDCAVVYKRVDFSSGDTRYIYHGNDGTGMPWNDTAQIDFLNPAAREAVIQEIIHVAQNFPIIRFDAAMVLAKKHIRRLWYPEPGHGGDIATRSEYSMPTQQFEDAIPEEFWREVVDRIATEVPDTLLLAEAFWMMEGYFVRTLGMHRVYNSAFMNMLKREDNQKYKETIKNTLAFDPQVLKRFVNFMNNPDEETAVAQFGKGDKYFGVCTLMATMPGLPMFGHGQIEGFEEKYGMEYTKAYRNEAPDSYLVDRHWREIFPLLRQRYLFAQVENFELFDVVNNGSVNENIFAYFNDVAGKKTLVFYNNKYDRGMGWIKTSAPKLDKGSGEMRTRTISQCLNLGAEDTKTFCIFKEIRSGLWFIRRADEVVRDGLFTSLDGFQNQILMEFYNVADTADGRYTILWQHLGGRGCENLEVAWQEYKYKDLYAALEAFITPEFFDAAHLWFSDQDMLKSLKTPVPKLEATLKAMKENAMAFYAIALRTAQEEGKPIRKSARAGTSVPPEEQTYKAFVKAVRNLNRRFKPNGKHVHTPAKALAIGLSRCHHAGEFMCAAAAVCILKKENMLRWGIERKMSELAQKAGLDKAYARQAFTKITLLSNIPYLSLAPSKFNESVYNIARTLLVEDGKELLAGVNEYDGIRWFNKETIETSLFIAHALGLMLTTKQRTVKFITLCRLFDHVKEKSGYKCDVLLEELRPAKRKGSAAKKKAPAKKKEEKTADKK